MLGLIVFSFGVAVGWFGNKYKTKLFKIAKKIEKDIDTKLDEIAE